MGSELDVQLPPAVAEDCDGQPPALPPDVECDSIPRHLGPTIQKVLLGKGLKQNVSDDVSM